MMWSITAPGGQYGQVAARRFRPVHLALPADISRKGYQGVKVAGAKLIGQLPSVSQR